MTRTSAILFLSFLGLYLLTMGGHIYSPDEEILFLTTKALAERGSLAIEPPPEMEGFATKRGCGGRQFGQYGIGQPLLAIPFYLFGKALAGWAGDRPIGFSIVQYHGGTAREEWERFGVSLFNQFAAALLVVLLFALAADLTGDRRAALMTAVLYGAGTIAWVHSKPFFTETLATLLVFSAFSLLIRARLYRRPGWITLAGCTAGYALLTRLDSVLAFPALGVLLFWPDSPLPRWTPPPGEDGRRPQYPRLHDFLSHILGNREAWARAARFAPPVVLAGIFILWLNWARFGSVTATGYEDQPEGIAFVNPLLVGLYGFLFSIGKGLFFFSPPLVLFLWSIRRFICLAPPAGWTAVTLVATYLLVMSKWINWAGGWCWGPRHIFIVHVFLALPICALLAAPRQRGVRIAYAVLLAWGVAVQLYGTSQNFIDYYYVAYQNPFFAPNATVLYNPYEDGRTVLRYYDVRMKANPFRSESRIYPWQMLAPISDSIWRFQNSPWGIYARMWARGYHDYFWLERLGYRSRAHEVRIWMDRIEEKKTETPLPSGGRTKTTKPPANKGRKASPHQQQKNPPPTKPSQND